MNKRINLQKAVKGASFVCEIGFNAGHSIIAMILANLSAHYVLFDIGTHVYARSCFEYLRHLFPETVVEIFWGDSRETVAVYHRDHQEILFDVVHIDGGHASEVYLADWKNSLDVTSTGSLLIFDDTDNSKIDTFIDKEIEKGIVNEATGFLETFGYEHRILKRK